MKHLDLGKDNSLFGITSAGNNALHYAIEAQPKQVKSPSPSSAQSKYNYLCKIDMNPLYVPSQLLPYSS
jgi:hypothetical protein